MGYVFNQGDPHLELLVLAYNPRNLFLRLARGYFVPMGHRTQNSALFIFAFLQACRGGRGCLQFQPIRKRKVCFLNENHTGGEALLVRAQRVSNSSKEERSHKACDRALSTSNRSWKTVLG